MNPLTLKEFEPQVWIVYKRPAQIPAHTTEADWPGLYTARRFERGEDKLLYPTTDLKGALTLVGLRRLLPHKMARYPRTPEDEETIVETHIIENPDFTRTFAGSDTMSSGMTVKEAAIRAAKWWNKIGRLGVDQEFNKQQEVNKVLAAGGKSTGPMMIVKGDKTDVIPSGILRGLTWDNLTMSEQAAVIVEWHKGQIVDPAKERQRGFDELLLSGEIKGRA